MLIAHCPLLLIVIHENTTLWIRSKDRPAEAVKAIVVPSQGELHVSISELLHTRIRLEAVRREIAGANNSEQATFDNVLSDVSGKLTRGIIGPKFPANGSR
jgi:hypothetical protein